MEFQKLWYQTMVLNLCSSNLSDFVERMVHHIRVAPYHPSSNGLAERAVQMVKQGLWKMTEGNLQLKLSRFLFSYRITPQSTTGHSPAELLNQRQLRSCLNLVQPSLSQRVLKQQTASWL